MKLSAPLRVTWDWNWSPAVQPEERGEGPAADRIRLIGEELARAGVLMLEVGYPGISSFRSGLVLSVVGSIPAQVSFVLAPETIDALGGDEPWKDAGPAEVWADATPSPELEGGEPKLPRRVDGAIWPDVRIYLTSANRTRAAETARRVVEEGCRRLSLPILPLFGSFLTSPAHLMPTWRDLVEFADHLDPLLGRFPDLDLRIHNQALWTLMTGRGFSARDAEAPGHSGCQAASALAYIDPGGIIYPCAALPVPLGRLERGTIVRLWGEEELDRLRKAIGTVPSECGECRTWDSCRGGCRGWAHFITGSWDSPGPDCGRPIDGSRAVP